MASSLPLIKVRKARPTTSFEGNVRHAHGEVRCSARFDVGNGDPVGAVLLPVLQVGDQWQLAGPDGRPIAKPLPRDVLDRFRGAVLSLPATDVVEVSLPWHGDTSDGLLLLLHDQIEEGGDEILRKIVLLESGLGFELDLFLPGPLSDATMSSMETREMQVAVSVCLQKKTWQSRLDLSVIRGLSSPLPPAGPAGLTEAGGPGPARFAAMSFAEEAASPPPAGFTFALSSCLYPAGMVDGTPKARQAMYEEGDFGPAHIALWRLAKLRRSRRDIRALILTGDQVYVDATAGLFDAKALADGLRVGYERLSRNPARSLLLGSQIEVLPLMDDHEIHDNWDGLATGQDELAEAKQAFVTRQRSGWRWPAPVEGQLWQGIELDGFHFFLADTRTERKPRTSANWEAATIYGPAQATELQAWIARHVGREPAFVVSPAILVPRRLGLKDEPAMAMHVDAWSGFQRSFRELMVWLYDARANNIVFLSGDEHVSCVASILIREDGKEDGVRVHSVHSSAFYAPFVFANARPEDFAEHEKFEFEWDRGRRFICEVEVKRWCPGDGFALLTPVRKEDGRWKVEVLFDRASGPCADVLEF